MHGYTVGQVSRWTGAKPQNILYWVRTGLVKASVRHTGRQRQPVLFAFEDCLRIGIIQELRARYGTPVRRIRRALEYLDRRLPPEYRSLLTLGAALPRDLRAGAVYLDVSGDDIHIVRGGREAESAVQRPGQKVILWVNLAAVRSDLEAKVRESSARVREEAEAETERAGRPPR